MVVSPISNAGAGITVLTVRLMFRHTGVMVNLQLNCGGANRKAAADGQTPNDAQDTSWDIPFHSFNPTDDAAHFVIARGLADDLKSRLAALEHAAPGEPLWLKLARPYGMLGTAPWERELCSGLNRPVLRLPDYPERPAERPNLLENAVLVDPASDAPDGDVVPRVAALVRSILSGSGREATRVHVFASQPWYERLAPLHDGARVHVYDPVATQASAQALQAASGAVAPLLRSSAWSTWIAQVMAGRGLDAVHLFCRARVHADHTGADLLLSSSPLSEESPAMPTAIDLDEICLLLDRAGAWEVTFVPVAPDQSQLVAFVADSIAHRRPGACLFHSLAGGERDASFAAACKLLFDGSAAPAPTLDDGFLYCHPSFLQGSQTQRAGLLTQTAALLAQRADGITAASSAAGAVPAVAATAEEAVPNWVGSTQRFLESAEFDQVRRTAADVLLSHASTATWGANADALAAKSPANATLADIQNVVTNFYLNSRKGWD